MSKPTLKITRTIRSEQVLNAFVEAVRKNLPLDLKNTRIAAEDILVRPSPGQAISWLRHGFDCAG